MADGTSQKLKYSCCNIQYSPISYCIPLSVGGAVHFLSLLDHPTLLLLIVFTYVFHLGQLFSEDLVQEDHNVLQGKDKPDIIHQS